MNVKSVVIVLIFAALLAACGEAPNNKPPKATVAPAELAVSNVEGAAQGQTGGDAVLIDGIRPQITHKVRSSRAQPQGDGSIVHSINAEYMVIDAHGVDQSLRQTFENKGYEVTGPKESNGIMKFVATDADGKRILYSITPVGPALKMKLASSDARGVIGFIWTDAGK